MAVASLLSDSMQSGEASPDSVQGSRFQGRSCLLTPSRSRVLGFRFSGKERLESWQRHCEPDVNRVQVLGFEGSGFRAFGFQGWGLGSPTGLKDLELSLRSRIWGTS